MRERVWRDLNAAQTDGLACVICAHNYLRYPTRRVPVGRSHTGSQVFACLGSCVEQAAPGVEWPVHIPDEALTAAGAAYLAALEVATATAGGDPRHAYPDDVVAETVKAAAPLIVAAELRRLAKRTEGHVEDHQLLRQRADELDPVGRGDDR